MTGPARKQQYEVEVAKFEILQNVARRTVSAAHSRAYAQSAPRIQTGIPSIDQVWGGLERSKVVPIVGSSRDDRTHFATSVAFDIATAYEGEVGQDGNILTRRGGVVAYYATALTAEHIATMILSEDTEIEAARIRNGDINNEEFERLSNASQLMQKVPFYVDATGDGSTSELSSRARRLVEKTGLDVLVVDYNDSSELADKSKARNRKWDLENIAKELGICILATFDNGNLDISSESECIAIGQGENILGNVRKVKYDLVTRSNPSASAESKSNFLERAKAYSHEELGKNLYPFAADPEAISKTLGGGAVLKRKIRTLSDLTRLVLDGMPTAVLDALASLGFSQADFELIVAPKRTLSRRRAMTTLLPSEGDAAVRLAKAYLLATSVLGERNAAIAWLHSPQHTKLGGRTPLEFLTTQTGSEAVEEILMQAAFGTTA